MENLKIVLLIITLSVIVVFGLVFLNRQNSTIKNSSYQSPSKTNMENVNISASFEIYTRGTKRIFTQSMYHNRSDEVYIENPDPSIIYVKKTGVTWDNFFKTLPFTLTKECLITGTKQTFCNSEKESLRFILNGNSTPNALDLEIKQGDKLNVSYDGN